MYEDKNLLSDDQEYNMNQSGEDAHNNMLGRIKGFL